jgi:uncharacterized coiled-coil protein SlyX
MKNLFSCLAALLFVNAVAQKTDTLHVYLKPGGPEKRYNREIMDAEIRQFQYWKEYFITISMTLDSQVADMRIRLEKLQCEIDSTDMSISALAERETGRDEYLLLHIRSLQEYAVDLELQYARWQHEYADLAEQLAGQKAALASLNEGLKKMRDEFFVSQTKMQPSWFSKGSVVIVTIQRPRKILRAYIFEF